MTAQVTPASGRDSGIPRQRTGSYSPAISDGIVISDGVRGMRSRPGESDPSRMLSGVLMLVIMTVIVALTLVWWLA